MGLCPGESFDKNKHKHNNVFYFKNPDGTIKKMVYNAFTIFWQDLDKITFE